MEDLSWVFLLGYMDIMLISSNVTANLLQFAADNYFRRSNTDFEKWKSSSAKGSWLLFKSCIQFSGARNPSQNTNWQQSFCQKIIFQELFPAFPLIFEYEARKYSAVWRTLCGPWVGTHVPMMWLWPWLSMPVTENSSLLFSFSHLQLAIFM